LQGGSKEFVLLKAFKGDGGTWVKWVRSLYHSTRKLRLFLTDSQL
jgi:hypothetical protein